MTDAPPDPEDLHDVRLACNGDQDAFARLVARHQPFVGRLLWRFTRDRTEWDSLVQDTFVEMHASLPGYRATAELEHWVARIATRIGFRFWKRTRRDRVRAERLAAWATRLAANAPARDEAAEILHELLGRLRPEDRLALTLVYLEGLDLAHAADRAGWHAGGMKMRLRRARLRLAAVARTLGIEPGDIG